MDVKVMTETNMTMMEGGANADHADDGGWCADSRRKSRHTLKTPRRNMVEAVAAMQMPNMTVWRWQEVR